MTTITTLAARITVLGIQGFMLDQRRSRDGPTVPRRLTAASDVRRIRPTDAFTKTTPRTSPCADESQRPAYLDRRGVSLTQNRATAEQQSPRSRLCRPDRPAAGLVPACWPADSRLRTLRARQRLQVSQTPKCWRRRGGAWAPGRSL